MDCLSGNLQTWNTNVSTIDQAIVLDQNQPTETNPDKSFRRTSKYETPKKAKCFLSLTRNKLIGIGHINILQTL